MHRSRWHCPALVVVGVLRGGFFGERGEIARHDVNLGIGWVVLLIRYAVEAYISVVDKVSWV
jgi:hypothetical protein